MIQQIQAAHDTALQRLAEELIIATDLRRPIPPLRHRLASMDLQDAYDIQSYQLGEHRADGRLLGGYKVEFAAPTLQERPLADQLDYGFFFEDMIYHGNARIKADAFIAPKVQPSFGFMLKDSLAGPFVTRDQAVSAIAAVYPVIEIVDSRITGPETKRVDIVADNASCGAVAVGTIPLDLAVDDLLSTGCTLRLDGEPVGHGSGAGVMGDPVLSLAFLVNLLDRQGTTLEAGQLILPGPFTAARAVAAGQTVTADFGVRGSLTIDFV